MCACVYMCIVVRGSYRIFSLGGKDDCVGVNTSRVF